MSGMTFALRNSYETLPGRMYQRAAPLPVKSPSMVVFNDALAGELGLPVDQLRKGATDYLSGNEPMSKSSPVALAYAGHQFGGFVPQLGDGRAHLLGEIIAPDGRCYDLQLKGSGPTQFSRGGDGRAALGPVLREYLVSEAMHALGVPTTRALAAVRTGEPVYREKPLPGAILARVASSHLRVGTFEYFAVRGDTEALELLVERALKRHYPDADDERPAAVRLLDCVISVQAKLVAKWMGLGFVHGVMNTDNCTISGETIDYGPCAFLDSFVPSRTFSSIDRAGRYAYDQQPKVAQWNLARFAESLLPLLAKNEETAVSLATDLLQRFPARFDEELGNIWCRKLGLTDTEDAVALNRELLSLMEKARADYTLTYARLVSLARSRARKSLLDLFSGFEQELEAWIISYEKRLGSESGDRAPKVEAMRQENPLYIPRNHLLEEALEAAQEDDLAPYFRLLRVVSRPADDHEHDGDLADPPGEEQYSHVTFCGT